MLATDIPLEPSVNRGELIRLRDVSIPAGAYWLVCRDFYGLSPADRGARTAGRGARGGLPMPDGARSVRTGAMNFGRHRNRLSSVRLRHV